MTSASGRRGAERDDGPSGPALLRWFCLRCHAVSKTYDGAWVDYFDGAPPSEPCPLMPRDAATLVERCPSCSPGDHARDLVGQWTTKPEHVTLRWEQDASHPFRSASETRAYLEYVHPWSDEPEPPFGVDMAGAVHGGIFALLGFPTALVPLAAWFDIWSDAPPWVMGTSLGPWLLPIVWFATTIVTIIPVQAIVAAVRTRRRAAIANSLQHLETRAPHLFDDLTGRIHGAPYRQTLVVGTPADPEPLFPDRTFDERDKFQLNSRDPSVDYRHRLLGVFAILNASQAHWDAYLARPYFPTDGGPVRTRARSDTHQSMPPTEDAEPVVNEPEPREERRVLR